MFEIATRNKTETTCFARVDLSEKMDLSCVFACSCCLRKVGQNGQFTGHACPFGSPFDKFKLTRKLSAPTPPRTCLVVHVSGQANE